MGESGGVVTAVPYPSCVVYGSVLVGEDLEVEREIMGVRSVLYAPSKLDVVTAIKLTETAFVTVS